MASRARRIGAAAGRYLGQGLKQTGVGVAAGAAGYFAQKTLSAKVAFLREKPLAGPIGMVVGGHLLKRKFPNAGQSLIGAGTYAGILAWDLGRMSKQAGAAPTETRALIDPQDVRALLEPQDIRGIEVDVPAPSLMNVDDAMGL